MSDAQCHDPGGKVATKLRQGMRGEAQFFGPRLEYRQWLSRSWSSDYSVMSNFALWMGLNPSTATADINDPTITREINFTVSQCGLDAYYKVNAMDYRSTKQSGLLLPGVLPRSENNLQIIRDLASRAHVIVLACGVPHKTLRHYVSDAFRVLKGDAREVWCLGKTKEGWPKHPLYLGMTTPFELFES